MRMRFWDYFPSYPSTCNPYCWCLALVVVATSNLTAVAQTEKKVATSGVKEEIPDPENVSLSTKDGVTIRATFYASTKKKKACPLVLLHAFGGSRSDFTDLALLLQSKGYAAFVPDLRGHGESKVMKDPISGQEIHLEPRHLRKPDFARMVDQDMEEVSRYLMRKNNAGELNIEKLGVVGVEMGATVALNWAAFNWSWPDLNTGKQGRDVKALVLVSPQWTFKGIPLKQALSHEAVQRQISILILAAGKDSKQVSDGDRIQNTLQRFRPELPTDEQERKAKQDLFFRQLETSLKGPALLQEKKLGASELISEFFEQRLVKQDLPWSDRKRSQ